MEKPVFTVFTPTYNRAYVLGRPYESLRRQTFGSFEWLIVDDGSSDDTSDLVGRWMEASEFPIRYIRQTNGGKHRAFNRGVAEAAGELFLNLDSDDSCLPHALACFKESWDALGAQKAQFVGITGLCADSKGEVIGNKFPEDIFDSDSIEMREKYGVQGEKWGFQRTDILREFPFPEIEGEKFITENIVWNRIARKYKTRFINEVLRTYEVLEDGLSTSSVKTRVNNPKGTKMYYAEELENSVQLKQQIKSAINYVRFCLHDDDSLGSIFNSFSKKSLLWFGLFGGMIMYRKDRSVLAQTN